MPSRGRRAAIGIFRCSSPVCAYNAPMTFQTTPGLRERFTAAPTEQPRWRITAKAMYGMMDAGILTEGDPVELISGELLLRSPQGPRHVSVVQRLWLELFRV